MISYLHGPLLVTSFFILLGMWRFWSSIDRLGLLREVGRRAPYMLHGDIITAVFAFMPFMLALADWSGVTLPRTDGPISPTVATFLSVVCLVGCIYGIQRNAGERFAGSWAGSRESALRTVAALRIIDAAELAHALDIAQQYEARQGRGRVIDGEVRK